ncbi:MAG TPA: hypothetical protein PKA27_00630 [Fimbriimonadaceae bacterium]|nr:hypothetical protein [Fimbriimonadaceae bacterium]
MKIKSILLGVALFAVAGAAQSPVSMERKYKVGETDEYKMKVDVSMSMGAVEVSMGMTQVVKKVYDNGDADIETTLKDMKIMFGGQEIPSPGDTAPPVVMERYNKQGVQVGKSSSAGGAGNPMAQMMNFSKFSSFIPVGGLEVGKSYPVDTKDDKGKQEAKGTIKVESIAEGVAKFLADLDVTVEGSDKPLKVKTTSMVDVSSSKPNKVEGVVTNLPSQDGMEIESVKFVMERVKK